MKYFEGKKSQMGSRTKGKHKERRKMRSKECNN